MTKIDAEAEGAVLGAVLLSEKALPILAADLRLRPDHFGNGRHGAVYAVMLALAERGEPVDETTVRAEIERSGVIRQMPGLTDSVALLAGAVPNAANVRSYAVRVIELARWRRITTAAQRLTQAATTEDEELVGEAERLLMPESHEDVASLSSEVYDYLAAEATSGIPWPFPRLTALANGGMQPGETTLIGGWTNVGKTALLDTMLQHAANRGIAARLYINEGSRVQRALRVIARETGVAYSALRARRLDDEQRSKVIKQLGKGLPFEIIQAADWSAADVARDMRWHPRPLVAIDILHEFTHQDERELAAVWQTLKAASTTTGAHLIATVHLNEARATSDKPPMPTLRDIRGSGMLKNGSDNVVFVHRDHSRVDGRAEMDKTGAVWFAKSRHGQHGGLSVVFDATRMRYVEQSKEGH